MHICISICSIYVINKIVFKQLHFLCVRTPYVYMYMDMYTDLHVHTYTLTHTEMLDTHEMLKEEKEKKNAYHVHTSQSSWII